jgi:hypothetical protein
MDMENIEKFSKSSWIIKKQKEDELSLTTTENNSEVVNVNLSTSNLDMTLSEFRQLFMHFSEIKDFVEGRDYMLRERYAQKMKGFAEKGLGSIPMVPPENVKMPEVYIITRSGMCLFHFDFLGKIKKEEVDQNLISGLISAINLFAERMGWLSGVSQIKSGATDLRFVSLKYVIVALVSEIKLNFSHLVEPIIYDLAHDVGTTFEQKFDSELKAAYENGIQDYSIFDAFKEVFTDFMVKYRKQVFELYQKLILTEAINLGAPPEVCAKMINQVSNGKTVVGELATLMNKIPIIKQAIQKVNFTQQPMWALFSIPTYEI